MTIDHQCFPGIVAADTGSNPGSGTHDLAANGALLGRDGLQADSKHVSWHPWPRLYLGFHGTVSILSAEQAVGWEPKGHNSANWLARIAGAKNSVNLMGCQVRAVIEGDRDALAGHDIYEVP